MFRTATTNKHSPTRQVRLMTDFGLKTNLSMKKVKLLILAALAVMISATSFAADADFPARPDTAIFVNDFAGVLRQSKVIDDSLRAFSKRTTNQIMVITVKDLGDYEPKMYAAELGDRWGIGQTKLDNGLIILIKPKTRDSKGQFALCPGRGLGGALPDVTCKRIVDGKAIPALKKGDYDAAVWAVLKAVMPICAGEISGDEATKKSSGGGGGWIWFVGIIAAVVGGVAYANKRAKKKQALIEANETPEERAARLAAAEKRKKELDAERKKREAEAAAAAAAGATTAKSVREKRQEEEERKRRNAQKFGGGSFDGGGASSDW